MFSLLKPHSKIPAHTGMVNCRFVCHLPLIVPPHCGFRVGATTREWRVGELMVFDDCVEHEAWNDSDHDRLILIFDVWRPELSLDERQQIDTLFRIVNAY
jgi:aspartyl/asparaginyl beta-hydroxylase (cupin superfamily)